MHTRWNKLEGEKGDGGFDARDQMERYVRRWKDGDLSSTGRCFDIGNTVRGALQRFLESGDPWSGSTHPRSAGNGSIMRLAPVPMFYFRDEDEGGEVLEPVRKIPGGPLAPKIQEIADGAYLQKSEAEIHGSGYVVESLADRFADRLAESGRG